MTINESQQNIEKALMDGVSTQGLRTAAVLLESWATIRNALAEKKEDEQVKGQENGA